MAKCETHYVDNQGVCHYCGKPMNFDYWLGSIGPDAWNNWEDHLDEWKQKVKDWEEKNS